MGILSKLKGFIFFFLALLCFQTNAGNFTVDGCFECGDEENYQLGYEVLYNFNGGGSGLGGLYFGEDDDGQYLFFKMAEEYVDTTYGANSTDYSPENPNNFKEHTFKDIIKSDNLGLNQSLSFFVDGIETKLQIDLLACVGSCIIEGSGDNKTYSNSNTFQSSGFVTSGFGDADGEATGNTSFIENIKTSMDYNASIDGFNTASSLDLGTAYNGKYWQSYVGYEFMFSPNTFDSWISPDHIVSEFLALGESHASPPRADLDDTTVGVCTVGCTSVPEPSSFALLLIAAVALTSTKRKTS